MMTLEAIDKKLATLEERKKKIQQQIVTIDEHVKKLNSDRQIAVMQKIKSSLNGQNLDADDVNAFIEFMKNRSEKNASKEEKDPAADHKQENKNEEDKAAKQQTVTDAEENSEDQSEDNNQTEAVQEEKHDPEEPEPVKPQPNISIIGQNNRYSTPPRKNPQS